MKLSRHAKHNLKLYGIDQEDVLQTIQSPDVVETEGDKKVAIRKFPRKYHGYPLKVVYDAEGDDILIITAYPLKKKLWR